MQNSLYKLFEHKRVLEVYVHIPPYNDKNPSSVFFIPIFYPPFQGQNDSLSELWAVRHCVDKNVSD